MRKTSNKKGGKGHNLPAVLRALMKERGVDDAILSVSTKIPAPTIVRLRTNPSANPTIATLIPIAAFFDITVSQLLGNEEILCGASTGATNTSLPGHSVPLIEWKDMLLWSDSKEGMFSKAKKLLFTEADISNETFAVKVPSNSHGPLFRKGTILVADTNAEPDDGDYLIMMTKDKKSVLLRQLIFDGNSRYLKPVNPLLEKIEALNDRYLSIATVIETRFCFQEAENSDADHNFVFADNIVLNENQ